MDPDILNTILKETYTQTQLKHRLLLLRSYLTKRLFESNQPTQDYLAADSNWLNSLGEVFHQKFTKDSVYQILDQLQIKVSKIVPLVIYLGLNPDDSTIAQIASFARSTFNKTDLILDIRFSPNLIAGCALSWKGIYKDYSLKANIEERKTEILQSFKKFLR